MTSERTRSHIIEDLNTMADKYVTKKALGPDGKQMRLIMDAVLPLCRKPRVLELGYGSGHWTRQLVKRGFDVTVVEGSSVLCKRCRNAFGTSVKVRHSLFERFSPSRSYDSIIASCVLEHVHDPYKLLKLMKSWLAINGDLHIIVPNALSLHRRIGLKMKILADQLELSKQELEVGHKRVYTPDILKTDLRKADLHLNFLKGVFVKPLSSDRMMDWPDELFNAFNELSVDLPEHTAFLYANCSRKK